MTIVGEAFVAISPEGAGFAQKLEAQLKGAGLGSVLQDFVGPAAVITATAALAAIGNQFDKVAKQIQQESGATGSKLTGLVDDAVVAFRKVPASLGDAGEAVSELFRRGVPVGPQLTNLAEQELFLAKITKEQLGPTVESTTSLFAKFNVPLADQSRELDVLFRGYQASGKGLDALTGNLQTGGAVLQQFGFNLDQSVALLALLAKAGVNVAPALAGLRIGFAKIVAEGGSPKQVLSDLIAEFQKGKDPAKAMADAIQLFGKRSGSELAVAISKGKFAVGPFLKQITDGKGGIIATGLATLTLGDQFKLLRNNVQADLSGLGTEVLHDLESGLQSTAVPLETLITGVAHFATALAPAAVGASLLLLPLKLLLPIAKDLGTGLDGISEILGHLPAPVIAVAGAVTVAVLAWRAYKDATLAALVVTEAFDKVVEFAGTPLGIFLIAVTALGAALSAFSHRNDDVKAAAKTFTDGIFQSSDATHLFTGDVTTATSAVSAFLEAELQGGKLTSSISTGLLDSGKNAKQLGVALTGTDSSFKHFRDSVVDAVNASSKFPVEQGTISLQAGITLQALNAERDGFKKSSQSKLDNLVVTGQLTAAQEKNIIATNTNKDGETNYAGALNAANVALSQHVQHQNEAVAAATKTKTTEAQLTDELRKGTITDDQAKTALQALGFQGDEVGAQLASLKQKAEELNQVQDLQAGKVVPLTQRYHDLASEIGQGVITEDAAEKSLQKMGFSAAGAKAQFSALQSQIQSFVSTAVSKLPDASQTIEDMNSAATTDKSKLQSDLNERVSLQSQLGSQLASGAASTQKALSDINSKIALDQKQIEAGQTTTTKTLENDQRRRDQILSNASKTGGQASASLAASIHKNDAAIAADQKKLAEDTSIDTFTKNLIKNSAQIVAFQSNLQILVTEGFGNLAGILAEEGPKAAAALAAGFAQNKSKAALASAAVSAGKSTTDAYTKFLNTNFPELALAANKVGGAVGTGIVDGVSKELLKKFPEIRRFGFDVGTQVGGGITDSLTPDQFAVKVAHDGHEVGTTFAAGIGKGIDDGSIDITKAVNKAAGGAIVQARKDFRSASPSLEGVDIGHDFVAGIALGITRFASDATDATSVLVGAVTDAASSGLIQQLGDVSQRLRDGTIKLRKGQSLINPKDLFPKTPFTTPTAHPSLIGASLTLTDASGTTREDALAQQRAAQRPDLPPPVANPPIFAGATLNFPTNADPLHIAADLDWLSHHGVDSE